jgi:cell volume regulation protein A
LTVSLISLLVNPNVSVFDLVPAFVLQMVLGAVLGTIMGRGMVIVMNRLRLEYEGLYPVLSLSLVLLTYSATTAVGGNGFLAVYLAGLVMGNNDFIHKSSLRRFHDGLAWLMQITMFLTLGLLVFPSRLLSVIDAGLLIAAFLILVARPASVFTTLLFSRLDAREKALVSWVGLRGAVPIILATFPLLAGLPIADLFFNLVFFVVLTSVILQGPTIPLIARWLGVDAPATARSKPPLELVPVSDSMNSELVELEIAPDSTVAGKQIVDLHLPPDALILLINRNNEFIVPRGGTILQAGDRLLVLADKEALARIQAIVGARGPKT